MNYSQVSISNLALNYIGARGEITDINENQPNAKKVLIVWDAIFQEVLSERDWKFAKIRVQLQLSPIPPLYAYCYAWALPSDFLRFVRPHKRPHDRNWGWLWGPEGEGWYNRNDPPFWPSGWPYVVETLPGMCNFVGSISGTTLTVTQVSIGILNVGQPIFDTSGLIPQGTIIGAFGTGTGGNGTYTLNNTLTVPSEMMTAPSPSTASGKYVLTNYPGYFGQGAQWSPIQGSGNQPQQYCPAKINYIQLISDYTQLMPGFVNCLAHRLASALAISITEDKAKADSMMELYRNFLNSAEAQNETMDYQKDESGSEAWVRAGRYASGYGGGWGY